MNANSSEFTWYKAFCACQFVSYVCEQLIRKGCVFAADIIPKYCKSRMLIYLIHIETFTAALLHVVIYVYDKPICY